MQEEKQKEYIVPSLLTGPIASRFYNIVFNSFYSSTAQYTEVINQAQKYDTAVRKQVSRWCQKDLPLFENFSNPEINLNDYSYSHRFLFIVYILWYNLNRIKGWTVDQNVFSFRTDSVFNIGGKFEVHGGQSLLLDVCMFLLQNSMPSNNGFVTFQDT